MPEAWVGYLCRNRAIKGQDEMESRVFLDVVVGESATVLQLLPGEYQPLLVRGNPLLILGLS